MRASLVSFSNFGKSTFIKVAGNPLLSSPFTWSDIKALSGVITIDLFGFISAGNWKQRLLPLPVGLIKSTDFPDSAAKIGCSCPGRNFLTFKYLSAKPSLPPSIWIKFSLSKTLATRTAMFSKKRLPRLACKFMCLSEWQPEHNEMRFSGVSLPPKALGSLWWTWAWRPLIGLLQSQHSHLSLERISFRICRQVMRFPLS